MRYVAGGDLRELLTTSGPLTPERTDDLLPVARALDTAHTHGLVHRDVKPANVLLRGPDGTVQHVYLSDFGVTKQVGSSGLTGAGAMVGTVDYMAPEQIQGGRSSPRPTSTRSPASFTSASPAGPVRSRLGGGDPVRPCQRGGRAGKQAATGGAPALDAAIAKGMAKLPGDRFVTCEQLVQACAAALGSGAAAPGPAFDPGTAAPGQAVDDRERSRPARRSTSRRSYRARNRSRKPRARGAQPGGPRRQHVGDLQRHARRRAARRAGGRRSASAPRARAGAGARAGSSPARARARPPRRSPSRWPRLPRPSPSLPPARARAGGRGSPARARARA